MSALMIQTLTRFTATPVTAVVKVHVRAVYASPSNLPAGQACMVWLTRNSKARGTQLVWAQAGKAAFEESLTLRATLYQNSEGDFQSKPFDLKVIRNDAAGEAVGQTFGHVSIDVSRPMHLTRMPLQDCTDSSAVVELSVSVEAVAPPEHDSPPSSPIGRPTNPRPTKARTFRESYGSPRFRARFNHCPSQHSDTPTKEQETRRPEKVSQPEPPALPPRPQPRESMSVQSSASPSPSSSSSSLPSMDESQHRTGPPPLPPRVHIEAHLDVGEEERQDSEEGDKNFLFDIPTLSDFDATEQTAEWTPSTLRIPPTPVHVREAWA